MQRARCQKTYHQVPFRKVGTRQPTDRPTLIPYPLFHSLSLSLYNLSPPYKLRFFFIQQGCSTSSKGGLHLIPAEEFSRIGRDIHDPLIVCPWGFGVVFRGGFYPRGWIRLAAKPGRILSLALVKASFLLVAIKGLTYYYGRELRGRCVIRGGILIELKVWGMVISCFGSERFWVLLPIVDSNHCKP